MNTMFTCYIKSKKDECGAEVNSDDLPSSAGAVQERMTALFSGGGEVNPVGASGAEAIWAITIKFDTTV